MLHAQHFRSMNTVMCIWLELKRGGGGTVDGCWFEECDRLNTNNKKKHKENINLDDISHQNKYTNINLRVYDMLQRIHGIKNYDFYVYV